MKRLSLDPEDVDAVVLSHIHADHTGGLNAFLARNPGVAAMAERAKTYLGKNVYLVMGGFHLRSKSDADIRAIIRRLKALGVKKVAPSHCTGDKAIRMFRHEWADGFIEGGLGATH